MDFLQDGSDCMKIEGFSMGSFFLSCFHFIFVDLSTTIMNETFMHLDVMNPRKNFMVGFCYLVALVHELRLVYDIYNALLD